MRKLLWVVLLAATSVVALTFLGTRRWSMRTVALLSRLDASRVDAAPPNTTAKSLDSLPPPVRRYLALVLRDFSGPAARVNVRHTGTFNMDFTREQWKRFSSTQEIVTHPPGFVWNARIAMFPGVHAFVHDAYIGGEGILNASVMGLVTVADQQGGGALAEGELMRFLAESAWYPEVLLPGQHVIWEPIDETSARATLRDGSVSASVTMHFGDDGLLTRVRADSRGAMIDGTMVMTPWVGRFMNYEVRHGRLIPIDAEVGWETPDGVRLYWRGHIEEISYAQE